MTEKLKIWVVRITYKHGAITSCYSTEQLALDSVARWAADNWELELCEGDPKALRQSRLIECYFEQVEHESCEIDCAVLDDDVPAPLPEVKPD